MAEFIGMSICSGIGGAELSAPWIDRIKMVEDMSG